MICFDEFQNNDKTVNCDSCKSKLCGECIVSMINHIDDKKLNNVVFTKEQRTFECPNMKCEGGTFNFDKLVNLLNIDEYLSMIAVVSEKISKNKEFIAIDNYKKFGDEKNLLQDVPEA